VARLHPEGACLKADLCSAAAAAQLDLAAVKADLQEMAAGGRWACLPACSDYQDFCYGSVIGMLLVSYVSDAVAACLRACLPACSRVEAALAAAVEGAAAGSGCVDADAAAQLASFRAEVVSRLAGLQAETDDAEAAFRWVDGWAGQKWLIEPNHSCACMVVLACSCSLCCVCPQL